MVRVLHEVVVLLALCVSQSVANAQWFDLRTPGIPRTADGRVNLTAPAPKMADGKTDFSGVWRPEANPYRLDLIQELKDESIFKPAAEETFLQRVANFRRDDPVTHCLPGGPSDMLGGLYRIVQGSQMISLMYEVGAARYRQIYLDGRGLPKDPNPTWLGYSVGHWDGDTLLVDTNGFNDRTWLDRVGHPHSESLQVSESFRRIDFGHIEYRIVYNDPEVLTKPISVSIGLVYAVDTDILETICNESESSTAHLSAKAESRVALPRQTMEKYLGTYLFRSGAAAVPAFVGPRQTVSIVNGQLYINAIPLLALSETLFDSTGGIVEFLASDGSASQMKITITEGEARFERQ